MMNLLYSGGYKKRFQQIKQLIKTYNTTEILELCFGDILIAKFCKENNIKWFGYDLNEYFVSKAKNKSYEAKCVDLSTISELPTMEICLIIGSLYHFHEEIHFLLSKMLNSSKIIFISEPIKNLSNSKNIIGWIARKSTNAGKGKIPFRYRENSLLEMLNEESKKLSFSYKIIGYYKKDIVLVIEKNGKNQD